MFLVSSACGCHQAVADCPRVSSSRQAAIWPWLALSVSGAQHLLWLTQQETLESNLSGPTQALCNTSTQVQRW